MYPNNIIETLLVSPLLIIINFSNKKLYSVFDQKNYIHYIYIITELVEILPYKS
jgi:hypothetical protein